MLRSSRFPVFACTTNRVTVTVAVLRIAPTLVTRPVKDMGGIVSRLTDVFFFEVRLWILVAVRALSVLRRVVRAPAPIPSSSERSVALV